jgi:hypothetical protein
MKILTIGLKLWFLMWLIYWAELLNGVIGILTFGFLNLDLASKTEHEYLKYEETKKYGNMIENLLK